MTTVQNVIDNGYAKSAAARPETMASPAELVIRVGLALREFFQVIARENPTLLGVTLSVPFASGGWARPGDSIRVVKVIADGGTVANPAIAAGTEINVVPYDDQQLCLGSPSVTEIGQQFIPTGQALDPSAGTLSLIYARAPVQPTQTTDAIDALFPTMFVDFLDADMALYLATKDQRDQDMAAFAGLKSAILEQAIEWAQGQTYSLQQRFPLVTPPQTNTNGGRQPGG